MQYINVVGTDQIRNYTLDGLGNWRNTSFTAVTGIGPVAQTEVRQHNGLNEITRLSNPTVSELINPTYDANGNLTNDGLRLYTWDALNRLCEVDKITGPTTSTDIAEYHYDALNRRIRKVVSAGGMSGNVPDGKTDFIYLGWRCVEDRDRSGDTDTLLAQYAWGIYLDELLQMLTYVETGAHPLSAGTYYPLQDLLYRTTALTDSSGSIDEAYDMDAYGNTIIFSAAGMGGNWWANDAAQADYPACPFIFTGQRFDAETVLYHFKRRMYLATLGTFLSKDPTERTSNLYRYVSNQPTSYTDPTGEVDYHPHPKAPEPPKPPECDGKQGHIQFELDVPSIGNVKGLRQPKEKVDFWWCVPFSCDDAHRLTVQDAKVTVIDGGGTLNISAQGVSVGVGRNVLVDKADKTIECPAGKKGGAMHVDLKFYWVENWVLSLGIGVKIKVKNGNIITVSRLMKEWAESFDITDCCCNP